MKINNNFNLTSISTTFPVVLILFSLIFFSSNVNNSLAQENEVDNSNQILVEIEEEEFVFSKSSTEQDETNALIFDSPRQTEKILELRQQYRDGVIAYRDAERRSSIAKDQYAQLQTLLALEEAVAETQAVLLFRTRLMITYTELVLAVLDNTPGIDLNLRESVNSSLVTSIEDLRVHRDQIEEANTRELVNLRTDEFSELMKPIDTTLFQALSLIYHGRLQTVYDQSLIVYQEIKTLHASQELGNLEQSRRQRAYTEIDKEFDSMLTNLRRRLDPFTSNRVQNYNRAAHQRMLSELTPIYAQLSRNINYLDELLTL